MFDVLNKYFWKSLILLGGLSMLVLAIMFAFERIVSADTADYMVHLVNQEEFYFGSQRFIAAITQVVPILFIKLQLPFKAVIQSYSISLISFHLATLLIILFYCKDQKIALALVLTHLLTGSLLFYYPVSEYQMGLSLSLLFYAFLKNKIIPFELNWKKIAVATFLLATIIYAHPLNVLFVFFLFVYLFLEQRANWNWQKVIGIGAFVFIVFISKYLLFSVSNDTNNVSIISTLKFFPLHAFKTFWKEMVTYHYLFLIFFFANLAYLFYQKKYKLLAFFIPFLYLNLYLCLSKQGTDYFHWYAAHIFQSVFYISIFTFVEQWSKEAFQSLALKSVIGILILISIYQVADRHRFNVNRIDLLDEYIQLANNQNVQKGFIDHKHPYNSKKNWYWAIEYETLVISTYKYEKPTSLVYKPIDNLPDYLLQTNEYFITGWGHFPFEEVNSFYFPLGNENYQIVPILLKE